MSKKPDEARVVRRIKTNMSAWVTGANTPGFPAQVADLSVNGCRLVWSGDKHLSGPLTVEIPDGRIVLTCRIAWQRGHSAGLKFTMRAPMNIAATAEDPERGEEELPPPEDRPGR